jgi:hypothetical protein
MSLERDTVDHGEYPKAFRRQHPIQQAKAERALRHEVRRRLGAGREDVDEVRRREVRKWPPARLGELIQQKAARRDALHDTPELQFKRANDAGSAAAGAASSSLSHSG